MKAKTHYLNEDNHYEVFFAYEDFCCGSRFGFYDELQEKGKLPNTESRHGKLACYVHSFYWNVTEKYDAIALSGKPTISEVKERG